MVCGMAWCGGGGGGAHAIINYPYFRMAMCIINYLDAHGIRLPQHRSQLRKGTALAPRSGGRSGGLLAPQCSGGRSGGLLAPRGHVVGASQIASAVVGGRMCPQQAHRPGRERDRDARRDRVFRQVGEEL